MEQKLLVRILLDASTYSLLLPIVAGVVRYHRLSVALKVLCWFLFLSALFEVVLFYTNSKGINNLAIVNVHNIVEYVFISLVFHRAFGSAGLRKAILAVLAVFVAFAAANLLWWQGPGQFNSWTMGLECLLLMGVVLLFLYEVFRQGKVPRLERYSMFWVASGALLYFAGNLFLFIFIDYVLAEPGNAAFAQWGIHSSVNIAANLCYTAGLWLSPGK